jgi:uncharacterized repeat protein (TIGR02543 family)
MASYSVLFIDKNGNGITGKGIEGDIPYGTRKLVFWNTGVEFHDNWNFLDSVNWDDNYQGTSVESITYNGTEVSDGEEVDYSDGNIEIVVGYEYTPSNPGGGGNTGDNTGGGTGSTGGDDTPMIVTFNYYVDGKLVDDTTFEQIEMDMGRPIDEIWPRTLECYHIRFDKINPVEDSNPGTSSNTSYNSLEFTYIYEKKFDENELVNNWPYTGTLNNYKLIHAFSDTYFSGENCVTINGIGYNPGESFTEKLIFHSNNTKTLEVNLYYTAVQVSTTVQSYNVDTGKYLEPDLWGYVSAQLGTRIFNDSFITTVREMKYPIPLTSGNSVYCKARAKAGFEFSKWVSTLEVNKIHSNYSDEKTRREKVLALPAVESIDTDLPNTEIKLSGYRSNAITAVFKGLKNEVKLYKGLDFNGGDTYYIWGGDNQWKNSVNSDVKITIPTRKGAKLLGWVEYKQDGGTGEYPTIRRSQYQEAISLYKTQEEAFNVICLFNEKIIKGVIRINNPDDEKPEVVLLSGVDGYTDRYGNWLTGNKTLYPLWIVEEYPIKYKSYGKDSLVVDETSIDTDEGKLYNLSPEDYKLPLTYTIVDNIVFPGLTKQGNIPFPEYYSFDKWEPSEIKKFTKTGEQTIVAHWVLDTYKITLEKNNNYANQSVKIKIGKSEFDKGINNPTTRTAYKSFEGWYTENNMHTNNGCDLIGKLIINKEGILQPNVEGYTDSAGKWIKKGNTTVYAKWTPEEYIITYNLEGSLNPLKHTYTIEDTKIKITNSGSASFSEVLENGLPLLSNTDLNPPIGKSLDGWYTNANYTGTKKQYLEKGSYGDKTFYGRYKPAEYDIQYYNIEGCTNIEDLPVKHVYGSKTKLEDPSFVLYDFLGWYTDENFENPITSIPADYNGSSTIKLYAKKVLKLIPIYYKDNKGNDLTETSFNSAPPISYDYENGTSLVKAHKNWYTFDGWYDNIECDGKSFMSLEAKEYTDIIILYCKFIPIEKTIKYYVDGVETTIAGNPSKYTVEDLNPYITLNNPQDKPGYNSIGWRKNSPSSTVVLNKIASVEDLNLYWVWEPNVVTITWDANGGSVSPSSDQYTYNGAPISIPTPTRTGYEFNGWYTSSTGGTKITDVGVTNKPTKNIIYYAQWSKQSYTLTWNPNGGTIPSSPAYTSGSVEYGTSIIKPGNPTKNYYVFTNWKDQYGNTNVASTMPAKNLTYTAQYEGKTITIKWDPNCSELTTLITTYKYGDAVEPTNLIRTGYIFVGWSTTKDGSNIQSTFGGTTVTSDSITYYAVWNSGTGIKYTVKHYKQTLSGFYNTNPSETKEHYGTTGNSVTPSVKNYTGFTSPTPKTVTIAADGSTVVEYYYTRNKYTISWDANGGEELTGDYTKGSVYFETPIVAPNDPIKEGYTFTGWNPSVPEIMPASDITFTASYEYEILDITPIEVDFNLETVKDNKIATNKWMHNVLGEPEKTSWENLSNIFKTDFGSNITNECVTVSDLGYFITTQSQYRCKKQNETAAIFSNITTSSSQKQNKYYELLKMNSALGSIEFKVTPVASTANVPNYPGTDGFIMYFSVGSNPKIYKATIPVNRTCRLQFRAVRTNDILAIHRIPCYYGNSTYKIIVPVIYMSNNNSNVHKLYSNTVLLQQAVNR